MRSLLKAMQIATSASLEAMFAAVCFNRHEPLDNGTRLRANSSARCMFIRRRNSCSWRIAPIGIDRSNQSDAARTLPEHQQEHVLGELVERHSSFRFAGMVFLLGKFHKLLICTSNNGNLWATLFRGKMVIYHPTRIRALII